MRHPRKGRTPTHQDDEAAIWWVLVLVVVLCTCNGCSIVRPPAPMAPPVRCQPLPACDVPQGANSPQLEQALQACVLEYRSMYALCAEMAGGW